MPFRFLRKLWFFIFSSMTPSMNFWRAALSVESLDTLGFLPRASATTAFQGHEKC